MRLTNPCGEAATASNLISFKPWRPWEDKPVVAPSFGPIIVNGRANTPQQKQIRREPLKFEKVKKIKSS